jgi:hypothetical protein
LSQTTLATSKVPIRANSDGKSIKLQRKRATWVTHYLNRVLDNADAVN